MRFKVTYGANEKHRETRCITAGAKSILKFPDPSDSSVSTCFDAFRSLTFYVGNGFLFKVLVRVSDLDYGRSVGHSGCGSAELRNVPNASPTDDRRRITDHGRCLGSSIR